MTNSPIGTRDSTLRVAIVGCGNIAHQHAQAYARSGRTELVGMVDIVPEHAEAYADAYGGRTYPGPHKPDERGAPGAGQHRHATRHPRRVGSGIAAGRRMHPGDQPGLGVTFNEEAAAKFSYEPK
jgi:threonine dehydrogenase-like Zn-dependent dehydrogenase